MGVFLKHLPRSCPGPGPGAGGWWWGGSGLGAGGLGLGDSRAGGLQELEEVQEEVEEVQGEVEEMQEVVAEVREELEEVQEDWREGLEAETQELVDLLNQPLTGEVLQEAFRCSECGKEFKNKRNLYFHKRRIHKNPGSCAHYY